MPVLIVSENTWPHDGFSRKRSMRPSSSVTTMPNSSGFSTDLSPIVTDAFFSRWNSTSFVKSTSHSASPEMTRKVSSRRPAARRTEPAVPSGDHRCRQAEPEEPQRPARVVVRHDPAADRRVQEPGRGFAEQIHVEIDAARRKYAPADEQQKIPSGDHREPCPRQAVVRNEQD